MSGTRLYVGNLSYNTTRETFPNVIFAGMFGFLPAELFKIEDPTERNAPKVSFTS